MFAYVGAFLALYAINFGFQYFIYKRQKKQQEDLTHSSLFIQDGRLNSKGSAGNLRKFSNDDDLKEYSDSE